MSEVKILEYLDPKDRVCFLETTISLLYPFSESDLERFISLTKSGQNELRDIEQKKYDISNSDVVKSFANMDEPTGLERLNFDCLSLNYNILWTEKLIDKYEKNWNWNYLSLNESIIWTEELINKYEKNWN